MDPFGALKQLERRKRDLLLESDINRQIIQLEVQQVRYRVEFLRSRWTRIQGVWKWALPFAGFLFARKFKKTAGVFTAASGLIPSFLKLWRGWAEGRTKVPRD
ncbi:MAG TPA: hypothetical protein VFA77_17670 [Candidatus Eisenbacteria bacterium]|nr:hypothetical protein [Candidatus Eisenbacteria bacterium]